MGRSGGGCCRPGVKDELQCIVFVLGGMGLDGWLSYFLVLRRKLEVKGVQLQVVLLGSQGFEKTAVEVFKWMWLAKDCR